jgi:hypothetical protein
VITHEANAVKNLAAEDQVLKDTEQRVAYEKSDIKNEMADFTAAVQHSHEAQMDRVWPMLGLLTCRVFRCVDALICTSPKHICMLFLGPCSCPYYIAR